MPVIGAAVLEAPRSEITFRFEVGTPALSILHFPYDEYHLPEESLDLIDEQRLSHVVDLATSLVETQLVEPVGHV
jgi:hypothetical protein